MPRRRKPELEWAEPAQDDLEAIRAYIALDSTVAADRFIARLKRAALNLRRFPYSGEVLRVDERGQVREIYVRSYKVIFHRSDEKIQILAVIHGARNIPRDLLEWSDPDEVE
jgi:plasmid stabilization system protein ParE